LGFIATLRSRHSFLGVCLYFLCFDFDLFATQILDDVDVDGDDDDDDEDDDDGDVVDDD